MTTIDANVPRFNQACVAVLTGLAFVLQAWPVVPVVAAVVAIDRFLGPRYGLFTITYRRFVRPRVRVDIVEEPAEPHRFAQALGLVMLALASATFMVGSSGLGWVLTLVVTALATLAVATRVCVGCLIYDRVTS